MLKVENLYYRIGNFTLKNISFSLERGEYGVILGPSGSGKTTLFELIAGFRTPLRGKIYLEGKDITDLPPEERDISVLYQDYLLFPHLNVFENIAFGLRKRLKDPKEVEKRVLFLAEELGIRHLLYRDIKHLSGGERQRVALARALAVKPKLLLLDEPFSALDPQNRERLRRFVKDITTRWGITTLHISHDVADAENLADKVILIKDGEIREWGSFERVFFTPKDPFAVEFLEVNFLDGVVVDLSPNFAVVEVCGNPLKVSNAVSPISKGDRVRVYFRPEVVRLGGENNLPCSVNEFFRDRFFVKALLNCCGREIKAYFPFEFEKKLSRKGEVEISIPPEFLFVRPL